MTKTCRDCKTEIESRFTYCGSVKEKTGCAYQRALKANREGGRRTRQEGVRHIVQDERKVNPKHHWVRDREACSSGFF